MKTMQEGSRTSTDGPRENRLRSGLVIAQAALGVMLVVGAVLLVRSFEHLSHSEIGFNPSHLVTAQFNLSEARYSLDQQGRFLTEMFNRVRVLPGVTAAAGAFPLPLYNDRWSTNFDLEEHPLPRESQPLAGFYVVVPGFFETMQIPLLSGRAFDARDRRDSAPVMIVTQAFARKYFPKEDPIGRQITVVLSEGPRHGNYRPREVIGVVGDIRRSNLQSAPAPAFYVPLPQLLLRPPSLMVRTATDPAAVTSDIRETLARMDPEIALYDISSMDEHLALDLGLSRFQTELLGVFAGIALLLTAVGLHGVTAYAVGRRIHEIGVRQALGASTWNVMLLVMSRGVRLTLAGIALGIVGALALARFGESLLYEVSSHDPVSYLVASTTVAIVGLMGSFIPAWQATRVDPTAVLRCQ
jgi:predicted permease